MDVYPRISIIYLPCSCITDNTKPLCAQGIVVLHVILRERRLIFSNSNTPSWRRCASCMHLDSESLELCTANISTPFVLAHSHVRMQLATLSFTLSHTRVGSCLGYSPYHSAVRILRIRTLICCTDGWSDIPV